MHEAYQRQGSKLRNAVRSINNINDASAVFQKVGKGTASTKSTHGMVPIMNLAHSNVECMLQDFYVGDWVDRLQELRDNIPERQVIASAGVNALGRKTDELIIDALKTASFETFGAKDIPDDGGRFAAIGWKQWTELLAIPEFSSADYIGSTNLPYTTFT